MYDPENPDADWSGFVNKKPTRRHFEGCVAGGREQIERTIEGGIQPREDAQVEKSSNFSGRRMVDPPRSVARSNTHSLIGGPLPIGASAMRESASTHWQTEAMAQQRRAPTTHDQYKTVGLGRQGGKRAMKPEYEVDLYQERQRQQQAIHGHGHASVMRRALPENSFHLSSQAPKDMRGQLGGSLLRSLSDRVPSKILGTTNSSDVGRARHQFAKDVSLIENYSDNVPGYTGRLGR